jgi:hypothetical protein
MILIRVEAKQVALTGICPARHWRHLVDLKPRARSDRRLVVCPLELIDLQRASKTQSLGHVHRDLVDRYLRVVAECETWMDEYSPRFMTSRRPISSGTCPGLGRSLSVCNSRGSLACS